MPILACSLLALQLKGIAFASDLDNSGQTGEHPADNCGKNLPQNSPRISHLNSGDVTYLGLKKTHLFIANSQKILLKQSTQDTQFDVRTQALANRLLSLEYQNFSGSTTLTGEANMVIGGAPNYHQTNGTSNNATTFNYDLRLFLDSSYTGQDLLRIRLRSDNFNKFPFGSSNSNIFKLVKASNNDTGLRADRIYYRFPLGEQWKLTIAAKIQISDAYDFKPTVYDSQILDLFNLAGAAGLYNKTIGPGIAASWKQHVTQGRPYWTASASFIAGDNATDSDYGLFNQQSALNGNLQVGLRSENWGLAVGYRRGTDGTRVADGNGTAGATLGYGEYANNLGISGYWQPLKSNWTPSISLGYGYTQIDSNDGSPPDSQSWVLGVQWNDVFASGNAAGFGIGQPPNATGEGKKAWLFELFYRQRLSDNISTTAALFMGTNAAQTAESSNWGGVIQTQFRF
ncbi:iron uptake porin [Cyanobium sp. WAJ14-Wanaka]|uniref:iron uptake porin n=1 Tax=Cyanobium sp. WAJ14-Wanaka TaxID=2823725 RepID=UPI0020CE7BAD|nr:iron uptake porin [Cyanobium sp. WAJ14-Wanaka]MCP9775905.1 iron uptake porin [Cyanobium sp. WAJ14-Wanaka]